MMLQTGGGEETPLHPLSLLPGCNTPAEITRDQLKVNIERDIPWLDKEPLKDKPLVIVGGGPSLQYRWPEITSHGGDIMALNNAYGFLLDHGIAPDYFMLLDARKQNVDFLDAISPHTRHLIAAQCHPAVFDELHGYKTTLYLTILPETLELTDHINKPKVRIAGNVGTVGMKALSMAYVLGYRELHLYGYDSSYEGESHHAFPQALNDDVKTLDIYLEGKKYTTTPTMAHQASEFCGWAAGMVKHYGFDITLHCSGLLPDLVAYSNKLGETPLEDREREKYRAMWDRDVYRKVAPGEMKVEQAIEALGMLPGESVIDFGCGTGRASAKFDSLGFSVTAIDFAENCLDAGVNVPLTVSCLWDLPDIRGKYGYCTDVMEHIPGDKVMDVLRGIAERTDSAFFNIATRDDSLGVLIGRKLHLSVMPGDVWLNIIKSYWDDVSMVEDGGEATFICKQPKR